MEVVQWNPIDQHLQVGVPSEKNPKTLVKQDTRRNGSTM